MNRDARKGSREKVVVLAPHPASGKSMQRYAGLLSRGYRAAGHSVQTIGPLDTFSRKFSSAALRKFTAYIETLIFFPIRILFLSRRAHFHVTDHSDAMWIWALKTQRRTVHVTCHDLLAVRAALGEIPEHMPRRSGRLFQRGVVSGLKRADLIHCVSYATKSDVERIVPGVPTSILYNPIDNHVVKPKIVPNSDYGSYYIMVSSSGWRKRRERGIEVWRALNTHDDLHRRLVIVGPPLGPSESAGDLSDVMVRTGVSDEDLASLYVGAYALIQQSKYEGFGWPVIEANANRVPAICADTAIFREIGPANIFLPENLNAVDWGKVHADIREFKRDGLEKVDLARYTWQIFVNSLNDAVAAKVS